jgi:hypothetical protein
MILKSSPETSGAIEARLQYLRNRKLELDEIIESLERYHATHMVAYGDPFRKPVMGTLQSRPRRLAGAA